MIGSAGLPDHPGRIMTAASGRIPVDDRTEQDVQHHTRGRGFLTVLGSACDDPAVIEWFQRWFGDDEPQDYDLPDPDLATYDHGLGELRLDGELKGYLASVRLRMSFPARQWWPWFVIVWADGRKDRAFEDYGPKWLTVRELEAGYFEHYPESGEPEVYEFRWLKPGEAGAKWAELGLAEDDF